MYMALNLLNNYFKNISVITKISMDDISFELSKILFETKVIINNNVMNAPILIS